MVPQRTGIAPEPQTVVFSRETTPTQDCGANFQRFMLRALGSFCCLFILVTVSGNVFFAASLFSDIRPALFAAVASMAVDAFKAALPIAIHSLRKTEPELTAIAWVLLCVCGGWSLICGISWVFMLMDHGYSGGTAESGFALLVLMLIAQAASAGGPVLIAAGMRHAKDLPDEEPPAPQAPQQMDFGMLEPAGDGMSEWLREVIGVQPGAKTHLALAYDHYITFCKMRGHTPMKQKLFNEALRMHGKALTGLDAGRDKSTFVPGISMAGGEKAPLLLRDAR